MSMSKLVLAFRNPNNQKKLSNLFLKQHTRSITNLSPNALPKNTENKTNKEYNDNKKSENNNLFYSTVAFCLTSGILVVKLLNAGDDNDNNSKNDNLNLKVGNSFLDSIKWIPLNLANNSFTFKSLLAKENDNKSQEKSIIITPRQKLFFQFASVEYEGIPYMTPQDFLESVTEDHPRPRLKRKILSKEKYMSFLKNTPSRRYGSNKLFRSLEDQGIISYSEYLFLLCVITRPKSNFRIAFNMFDQDGDQRVDKNEFLLLERVMSKQAVKLNTENEERASILILY